jgi:hypothetical protein
MKLVHEGYWEAIGVLNVLSARTDRQTSLFYYIDKTTKKTDRQTRLSFALKITSILFKVRKISFRRSHRQTDYCRAATLRISHRRLETSFEAQNKRSLFFFFFFLSKNFDDFQSRFRRNGGRFETPLSFLLPNRGEYLKNFLRT